MPLDLSGALQRLRDGRSTSLELMRESLAAARSDACQQVFVREFFDTALASAEAADLLRRSGLPGSPLQGLAISVKDLFDVAGQPTTGGSASLLDAPIAAADAACVARLRQAGAAFIGHSNLSEFAFSGVGINPHHGTPLNPVTRALDGKTRIPGGSTSGGAVSVACGAAWAALGSDTGGSIRIPAALQGLVGFKNTARLTPNEGCMPLSTSLDTSCAVTRSVRDAALLHELLSGQVLPPAGRPLARWRLGVVRELMQDALEPAVARAFERALQRLRAAGAQIEELSLAPLQELPALQAQGGLPAAESWAWHRQRLLTREAAYDPRVALRIKRGATISAADYIDLLQARRRWIAAMQAALQGVDTLLSPTVPMTAPELAPLLTSDDAFFATNTLLLRNTSVVNLLDGCALSLPCHEAGELPVGLMLWNSALRDADLLAIAAQIEPLVSPSIGGH
ncbi:amidase [Paucibacter sediminis]|uniref:Amidase n=1 Tax=Paucibacter sediminis TaxID=3019553 RepID=A0AA95NLE1_9BURK|nr:amidase [Paucibacter sp. S2-9]WIT11816.1 amidase [Paucibacter sp. S2-9]